MTEKPEIRKRLLRLRDAMTQAQIAAGSAAILERLTLLEPVRRALTLMVYLNFGSEVVTDDLVRWGLRNGKRIAVARCIPESRGLAACQIGGLEEVAPGHYGIREPKAPSSLPVPAGEIDAVIVPAVAFDRRGYRIGYGGGYYDRFLPQAPQAVRIGIAFACQVVDRLPVDVHDIPMDGIVTDAETIIPAGGRPGFLL
jgi:5-formyltetrahydrofolate cyclo-ligase